MSRGSRLVHCKDRVHWSLHPREALGVCAEEHEQWQCAAFHRQIIGFLFDLPLFRNPNSEDSTNDSVVVQVTELW